MKRFLLLFCVATLIQGCMAAEFDEYGLWTSYDEGRLNIVLMRKNCSLNLTVHFFKFLKYSYVRIKATNVTTICISIICIIIQFPLVFCCKLNVFFFAPTVKKENITVRIKRKESVFQYCSSCQSTIFG